ncbi:hypothetical protein WJX74_010021 [Apatococcus lobatus]|uniref:DNA topoisomerase n=1 Tax=Apatococcus lobatus TaxID=904363 RepID=A0AAW1QN78_9CHLO
MLPFFGRTSLRQVAEAITPNLGLNIRFGCCWVKAAACDLSANQHISYCLAAWLVISQQAVRLLKHLPNNDALIERLRNVIELLKSSAGARGSLEQMLAQPLHEFTLATYPQNELDTDRAQHPTSVHTWPTLPTEFRARMRQSDVQDAAESGPYPLDILRRGARSHLSSEGESNQLLAQTVLDRLNLGFQGHPSELSMTSSLSTRRDSPKIHSPEFENTEKKKRDRDTSPDFCCIRGSQGSRSDVVFTLEGKSPMQLGENDLNAVWNGVVERMQQGPMTITDAVGETAVDLGVTSTVVKNAVNSLGQVSKPALWSDKGSDECISATEMIFFGRSQQPANSTKSQASSSRSSTGMDATAAQFSIVDLQIESLLARETFLARLGGKKVVLRLAFSPNMRPHVAAEVSALTALQSIQGSDVPQLLQHGVTTEGFAYVMTEYIEGHLWDPSSAADRALGEELHAGLRRVHQLGVIQNDVKCDNIIVEHATGLPRFIDFALATHSSDEEAIEDEDQLRAMLAQADPGYEARISALNAAWRAKSAQALWEAASKVPHNLAGPKALGTDRPTAAQSAKPRHPSTLRKPKMLPAPSKLSGTRFHAQHITLQLGLGMHRFLGITQMCLLPGAYSNPAQSRSMILSQPHSHSWPANIALRSAATHAARSEGHTAILVESPAKAKKLQTFLGDAYKVTASKGHIVELQSKRMGVDPGSGYALEWELLPKKKQDLQQVEEVTKGANAIVLATDPDREGEGISWHLLNHLQEKQLVASIPVHRVTFTEITKKAVTEALASPRTINGAMVDAYLARRALDRLFGYTLSPLLWRKLPCARSAGRVQSAALRLLAHREEAIEAFRPVPYWSVSAQLSLGEGELQARLVELDSQKIGAHGLDSEDAARSVIDRLSSSPLTVMACNDREVERGPPAPFTTSTLQQEANSRLGWPTSRTMSIAQDLFEGSNIDNVQEGVITYHRTDGVTIGEDALKAIRATITQDRFSHEYLAKPFNVHKSKAKVAQEAHEAIRPTNPGTRPDDLKASADHLRLYDLILRRTLASEMHRSRTRQLSADIATADKLVVLRASGRQLLFGGWLKAWEEPLAGTPVRFFGSSTDDDSQLAEPTPESGDEAEDGSGQAPGNLQGSILGDIMPGDAVAVSSTDVKEHSTQPPGRFSEGSLVKELEVLGIGRPSTYSSIIRLLQERGYVSRNARQLKAASTGRVLTAFLELYFHMYVDYDFTADMEAKLDKISGGQEMWQDVMDGFWRPFKESSDSLMDVAGRDVITELDQRLASLLYYQDGSASEEKVRRACPACQKPLSLKLSRGGVFVGCTDYPACKFTRPLDPQLTGGSLGECSETGEIVSMEAGPFGMYIKAEKDGVKTRSAPLAKLQPDEVNLEVALDLLSYPKVLGTHPESGDVVELRRAAGTGRVRVGHGQECAYLPKDVLPMDLDLEAALTLLNDHSRVDRFPGKRYALPATSSTEPSKKSSAAKSAKNKSAAKGHKKTAAPTDLSNEHAAATTPKKRGRPASKSTGKAKAAAKSSTTAKRTAKAVQATPAEPLAAVPVKRRGRPSTNKAKICYSKEAGASSQQQQQQQQQQGPCCKQMRQHTRKRAPGDGKGASGKEGSSTLGCLAVPESQSMAGAGRMLSSATHAQQPCMAAMRYHNASCIKIFTRQIMWLQKP